MPPSTLDHLTATLSHPATRTSALPLLYHTLTLLHANATTLLSHHYASLASHISLDLTSTSAPPISSSAPESTLLTTCLTLSHAAETLNDTRYLLNLLASPALLLRRANAQRQRPSHDAVVKMLVWAGLGARAVAQIFESGAFLARKGFPRGKGWRDREGHWWRHCRRARAAELALEMLRWARVRQLRFREEFGAEGMATGKPEGSGELTAQSAALEARWKRQLLVTAAELVPSLRWSFAAEGAGPNPALEGCEAWTSLLCLIPGVVGVREAWRATAGKA